MLITSAQVSVAVSSFIVFIFTIALFLAGYILQQQTVRDLRAAIKPQLVPPRPGPELYLPPQFRDAEYWEAKGVVDAISKVRERVKAEKMDGGAYMGEGDDTVGTTRWQKAERRRNLGEASKGAGELPMQGEEREEQPIKDEGEEKQEPSPSEKPMSRAERLKLIKSQILAEGEGEEVKGYRRRMW